MDGENSTDEKDAKNLLICFMNEILSSDEEDYVNITQNEFERRNVPAISPEVQNKNNIAECSLLRNNSKASLLESLSTSSLVNNISRHKGHVIIPLSKSIVSNVPSETEKKCEISTNQSNGFGGCILGRQRGVPRGHLSVVILKID